ncbi:hypothetical protein JYQ62_23490 [Nostoc sp. UHCC 0702]|nr:hypothetical protein JYQ62_23490 [Nostoc sp. UHCC 0702]
MVKSNKKPNRLAELAKGLQEQTVQEPHSSMTQVTDLEPAASVSVTQVASSLESLQPDENEVKELMPDAIAQQPVTPDSEEPQTPIDAKALAVELLNILEAKQASQAQNQSSAAALGLEIQDEMPSNTPNKTTTKPQPVSATVISSFDQLDKRLKVEMQQEEAISSKPEFTLKDYYEACASVKNIKTPQLKEMIAPYEHIKKYLNIMQEANACRDNQTVGHWWRALHPEKNQIVSKEKEIQEAMFKFYQTIFTLEGCEANQLPNYWTKCVKILSIQNFTRTPLNTVKFGS